MLESLRRALAIEQKLADENPTVTEFRRILARANNDLGLLQSQTGESAEVLESLRRAVVVRQKLAEDNPAIPGFRNSMAASQTNVADLLRAMGWIAEARECYERAIVVREELVKADPNGMPYRNGLAMSVRRLGLLRWAGGDTAGGISDNRRAVALFEKLRSCWASIGTSWPAAAPRSLRLPAAWARGFLPATVRPRPARRWTCSAELRPRDTATRKQWRKRSHSTRFATGLISGCSCSTWFSRTNLSRGAADCHGFPMLHDLSCLTIHGFEWPLVNDTTMFRARRGSLLYQSALPVAAGLATSQSGDPCTRPRSPLDERFL